jgi:predicted alpha/beta hydrolase family esterase
MMTDMLFIQGGGAGAHEEDAELATSLRRELGTGYRVRFPRMPGEDEPDYTAWAERIEGELSEMADGAILIGHSIGASVVIKWLSEKAPPHALAGVFLVAAPFWHDHQFWHWKEVELSKGAAAKLPKETPIHMYQGEEDEIVPFEHLDMYAKAIPQALIHPLPGRNHQLNGDLSEVAREIKRVMSTRRTAGRGGTS